MTKPHHIRHRVPAPTWIKDGTPIVYNPECPPTGMHGFVAGEPWLSTGGRWLVRLRDLQRPDRPEVPAGAAVADVYSIQPRQPRTP